MSRHLHQNRAKNRSTVRVVAFIVLIGATLLACPVSAETYVSAEPIPSVQIVGKANLAKIEGLDYSKRALWGLRLLYDCGIVQNVISTLSNNKAISTIRPSNTLYGVAAGGFEGVTDPSYVFKIEDSGPRAASAADIFVLDNALGYALNQGGTAQFGLSYDPTNPYTFPLAYAVVTFKGYLTGEGAQKFFNYLGAINPALWSGTNAGFTQIALDDSGVSNSMLFLIGNVAKDEFIKGIFKAAVTTPGATYSPLEKNGTPTTATAGAAFPGNELAELRQKHLRAVADLLHAINNGDLWGYLGDQFKCP